MTPCSTAKVVERAEIMLLMQRIYHSLLDVVHSNDPK